MTESAFPFAAQQDDAAAAPAEETSSEDRNRRLLLLVGGAAGVLVLLVAAYFLFLKSDTSEDLTGPVVPARVTQPAADTTDKAGDKAKAAKKQTTPRTFNDVVARDPFKPLVEEPVAVDPGVAGAAAGAGTGVTTPSDSATPSAPQATTGFQLVNVHKKSGATYAKAVVNGETYDVKAGDVFGSVYMLLQADGKTATFVEGDEQFTLTEGQTILR